MPHCLAPRTDTVKTSAPKRPAGPPTPAVWLSRLLGAGIVLLICGLLILGVALTLIYPHLPSLESLTDYRPKVPLRVYTEDGELIGEFGEERRNPVRIQNVPTVLKQAILAAEDDSFYQHGGIDYMGVMRAALSNITSGGKAQGASTITMQVARNFFLTKEKTWTRKLYEILLAFKIEASLSKDQIFELYINQIYLGQRAYGFASASRIYFNKPLKDLSAAEAAMLAGLPKAPSAYNPVVNPKRATARQHYILGRMRMLGFLAEEDYQQALKQILSFKPGASEYHIHAEYVAEAARLMAAETFKDEVYTRGINVYTTILKNDQIAAYNAVRRGILGYERRQAYRGPEGFVDLKGSTAERDALIDDAIIDHPDADGLLSAVVLEAKPQSLKVARSKNEIITITGEGLRMALPWLQSNAPANRKLMAGAIVRITKDAKERYEVLHMPEVESAFVSISSGDGAIRSLVGGFDFGKNKFNHVTQAWRQPGSSFKPFIYSAALEKGFSPTTMVNDAPIHFDAGAGGQPWDPKNYDGKYEGPMRLRQALAKSKNMVSIRVLQAIGPKYGQEWATRFGFEAAKHPAYLTLALGAGAVTPLQMAGGYAVFANGGYRVLPYLIAKITDNEGHILAQAKPMQAGEERGRVIEARNAFMMDSLLKEVVRSGTAARAMSLKRTDLAGKTGTTNDSHDAWFAGYHPALVGIAWVGYDQPKKLGDRETGGGLALPIWIDYMTSALRRLPESQRTVPDGISVVNDEFFYVEYVPGAGVNSVGMENSAPAGGLLPAEIGQQN
ncbi:MAG: penicillin-binding protein 1A [Burkholderiaceae bacterium]